MKRLWGLWLVCQGAVLGEPLWLVWDPPTNHSPVSFYSVYQVAPTNGPAVLLGTTTNHYWQLKSLPQDTSVKWLVAANNGPVEGPRTEILFSPATSLPGAIRNLSSIPNLLTNGSFEEGTNGWTFAGNVLTFTADEVGGNFSPADGKRGVVFNAGNRPPNGSVRQTLTTTAGSEYALSFEVGIVAFVEEKQALCLTVRGRTNLLNQVITLDPPANAGRMTYLTRSFSFIADSPKTELIFEDVSKATDSIDLLLDKVVVGRKPSTQ